MTNPPEKKTRSIKLYPFDPAKLEIREAPFKNIAVINHLQECAEIYRLIHNEEFRQKCRSASPTNPVKILYFDWYSWSDDLLTLLLQRAVLGTESFLTSIVLQEIMQRGLATAKTREYIRNPFVLGGGTADAYYNKLPAQIDPKISLSTADPELWLEVKAFYKDARNKIFHGYRLNSNDPVILQPYFEILRRLYLWMDSWFEDRLGGILPIVIRKYWPDVK